MPILHRLFARLRPHSRKAKGVKADLCRDKGNRRAIAFEKEAISAPALAGNRQMTA
jgi:hypothetical protein